MKKTQKRLMALVLGMALMFGLIVIPSYESKAEGNYSFSGMAHVQTYGDKAGTWDGTTLKLGTTGQAKRLESVTIKFENNTGYDGSIEYRVHRQTYGWTEWVGNGQAAGTTGQGKRLEGIQIRLTGELANHYSVKYRVHIQTYGWNQGWQYDGALAGTEAEAKRLESLEIQLVPKKSETMNVIYRVHRQTYGWETAYKKNGEVSGTTGQGKRLEGIEIALTGNEYNGSILYNTHVQSYGWMDEVENGMMSGTSGKAKRLEAIKIRLSGEVADHYDVYYRVHAQSYGWLGWAKNGQEAGTSGQAKRLEAIQIVLVKKRSGVPGNIGNVVSQIENAYITGDTHIWTPATCTSPKTCTICGATEGSALGHDFSIDKPEEVYNPDKVIVGCKCSDCGQEFTVDEIQAHQRETFYMTSYKCNDCNYDHPSMNLLTAHQEKYGHSGCTEIQVPTHHSGWDMVEINDGREVVHHYFCSRCGKAK